MKKVTFGILSTAKIGVKQVIPAMQKGQYCDISAICSRNREKAESIAKELGIAKAYGSYEELLADKDLDAVYNPLPNNLHVPWTMKALEAGKHVLCEKPLAMTTEEAGDFAAYCKKFPKLKVMEAFMYRHHPQWKKAKEIVDNGGIGKLKTIQSFFSYYNDDASNIRNIPETGGGGMMDIGCYCISLSRFIFGKEPVKVCGAGQVNANFNTDVMFSGILDFDGISATFTCSTLLSPYQRVNIFGDKGRVEIIIPFNAPNDVPTELYHETSEGIEKHEFQVCDQYTLQGDSFARSVLDDVEVLTPIEDAVANMAVLEACLKSGREQRWVRLNA